MADEPDCFQAKSMMRISEASQRGRNVMSPRRCVTITQQGDALARANRGEVEVTCF
jgi:hypothetical protein